MKAKVEEAKEAIGTGKQIHTPSAVGSGWACQCDTSQGKKE